MSASHWIIWDRCTNKGTRFEMIKPATIQQHVCLQAFRFDFVRRWARALTSFRLHKYLPACILNHAIHHFIQNTQNRINATILFAKQQTNFPLTLIFAFNFQAFVCIMMDSSAENLLATAMHLQNGKLQSFLRIVNLWFGIRLNLSCATLYRDHTDDISRKLFTL